LKVKAELLSPAPLITAQQIEKRVHEISRQISDDYRGRTVHVLAVLENSFGSSPT
jgi:hypoxanthine-guanine phosphoribosyltransferase